MREVLLPDCSAYFVGMIVAIIHSPLMILKVLVVVSIIFTISLNRQKESDSSST